MPIRPENKALYPANWKEIRERIRTRAGNKCEQCGIKNGISGERDIDGVFHEYENTEYSDYGKAIFPEGSKIFKIVCTVAHLDHDPRNNADENLRFWCQKCHNGYDAKNRAAGIKKRNMEKSGQKDLFK